MRADESPRNRARAGRARRYTSCVRSSASARSPSRAHTRQTSGWVRRTNAVDRDPVAAARRQGQRRQIVHRTSLVGGNQRPSRATSRSCDATPSEKRSRLASTMRTPGLDDAASTAHLAHLPRVRGVADELATLHRMVRVRRGGPVPDLTAAILGRVARARAPIAAGRADQQRPLGAVRRRPDPARAGRTRRCSSARTAARPSTSPVSWAPSTWHSRSGCSWRPGSRAGVGAAARRRRARRW